MVFYGDLEGTSVFTMFFLGFVYFCELLDNFNSRPSRFHWTIKFC